MTGTILKALSGFYYVDHEGETITCRGRGKLRYEKNPPLVGDRVEITIQADGSGAVEQILPRKNQFRRPAVANMDCIVVVASGAIPVTDPFLIDRVVAMAEHRDCESIICFNKWDLEQPQDLYKIYADAGFSTLRVSAETGEGVAELAKLISGKICAFTGDSGVGKSSLLNALGGKSRASVGEVSKKLGRGRHTTRHVELFRLNNNTLIADTPGFAAFEETEILRPEEIASTFREFAPYVDQCRFVGCAHVKEKGCAVLKALADGSLSQSRHQSYVRLYEQAKSIPDWQRKKLGI